MNITYNLHGDNPRVNINSQDYSINTKNSEKIFQELAKAISESIPEESLKGQLLDRVKEMEQKLNDKQSFLRAYSDFIALAANHMTIIGPYIPALTQFISQ